MAPSLQDEHVISTLKTPLAMVFATITLPPNVGGTPLVDLPQHLALAITPSITPMAQPYKKPLNYLKYKKNLNMETWVSIFKATIITGKIMDEDIINMLMLTFKGTLFNWCNNYFRNYPNYKFAKLEHALCKRYCIIQNDEHVYCNQRTSNQSKLSKWKCIMNDCSNWQIVTSTHYLWFFNC
jgi:hypothetical protein